MARASNDELDAILASLLDRTLYASLHTGDPGATGANEVSGGDYARVAIASGDTGWGEPSTVGATRQRANLSELTFPVPSGDQGTVTHGGLWDASSGGNWVNGAALTGGSQVIANGDGAPTIAIGALTVTAG